MKINISKVDISNKTNFTFGFYSLPAVHEIDKAVRRNHM